MRNSLPIILGMLLPILVRAEDILVEPTPLTLATAMARSLENASQNWLILDLGLLFASNMLAFSLWYQLADAYLKGGAFDFPPNGAHPDDPPRWIDYLYLSFNTQTTFGPTIEGIRTRPVKVMMMLQTTLSVILLVVLVARIIVAPS